MKHNLHKILAAFLILSFFYGYADLFPFIMAYREGPVAAESPAACGMAACRCSQGEHPGNCRMCKMADSHGEPSHRRTPARPVCSLRASNCDPVTNAPVLTLSKNILSSAEFIEMSCFPDDLEFIAFFPDAPTSDYVAGVFRPPRV